jgi:hypothetical protein
MTTITYRGLDILKADETTEEDIRGLREYNANTKGYTPESHEMWLDQRPDVFKRKILTILMADTEETRDRQARNLLSALHYYTIIGYQEGALYEIRQARIQGASKGQVLDTLAVAYTHAHAFGMNRTAEVARQYFADWTEDEPDGSEAFPEGWAFDPGAFKTGMDFSQPDLSPDERRMLEDWYLAHGGEIPKYVTFLADHRPSLLKAHRNRYENAAKNGLPKEMVPYLLLYFNVVRGNREGIREQVLLMKSFRVEKDYIVGCMCRAMTSYGGPDAISIAADAAGDLVDSM